MPELSIVHAEESQAPIISSVDSTQHLEIETAALKEGLELLRSLEREPTGLPPYMTTNVERCKESINKIFKTTFNLIQARRAGTITTDEHSRTKILLLKDAGQTLKRYLIVYHHERLNRIRKITRNTCGILGQSLKANMSKNEQTFAEKYYRLYIDFENDVTSNNGLKLLTNNSPPKLEYYYYRCKEDYGEYELADGNIIIIKRGLIHHMPKENAETLLRSGIVEQVHM
uniref:DNA replication complex GINS protein PSF1 n=1 Tax=Strongyloides papillosus TaxID=174720 RepID=A0A0N5C771_STREA